jgi:DNA invertase Pin-like site-specific DNA recombinase
MKSQVVGYIRVSSQGQNTARQLQGIELDREFIDIVSGVKIERENLSSCIDYVRAGDTLVVDSIDRLARNLRGLQDILNTLIAKGVTVKFVKENLTFTANHDPMSTLMLQMMGAFAEFERNMIRTRQREGIDLAKKSGKHIGRPPTINDEIRKKAKQMREEGLSIRRISIVMGFSRITIYKALGLTKLKDENKQQS